MHEYKQGSNTQVRFLPTLSEVWLSLNYMSVMFQLHIQMTAWVFQGVDELLCSGPHLSPLLPVNGLHSIKSIWPDSSFCIAPLWGNSAALSLVIFFQKNNESPPQKKGWLEEVALQVQFGSEMDGGFSVVSKSYTGWYKSFLCFWSAWLTCSSSVTAQHVSHLHIQYT